MKNFLVMFSCITVFFLLLVSTSFGQISSCAPCNDRTSGPPVTKIINIGICTVTIKYVPISCPNGRSELNITKIDLGECSPQNYYLPFTPLEIYQTAMSLLLHDSTIFTTGLWKIRSPLCWRVQFQDAIYSLVPCNEQNDYNLGNCCIISFEVIPGNCDGPLKKRYKQIANGDCNSNQSAECMVGCQPTIIP
ncbi:MAG: hypothetical protein NT007_07090 [Candidatus Kapabacteria bacterium]|nr:hypothetical protein [Candidatus Kapabacteria bacterium]